VSPRPTTPHAHAHARAVREARESLRVEREYEDADGEARALARLAELGVDEAGEPVAPQGAAVAS
jgi:hypothetical protein